MAPRGELRKLARRMSGDVRALRVYVLIITLAVLAVSAMAILVFFLGITGLRQIARELQEDLTPEENVSRREIDVTPTPEPEPIRLPMQVDNPMTREFGVRVKIWDETKDKPLSDDAEVWMRGHGSWWIKKEIEFGAASKDLKASLVAGRGELSLYPAGRNGQEVPIPFIMDGSANPKGSDRWSITITIWDDKIEIVGLPIEAVRGDTTMTVARY